MVRLQERLAAPLHHTYMDGGTGVVSCQGNEEGRNIIVSDTVMESKKLYIMGDHMNFIYYLGFFF